MSDDIPMARRETIADRLARGQSVIAATLADEFGVSEDAIRRDLRALAAEGRCRRVYGGALPLAPGGLPMAARIGADRSAKQALARAAAATIKRGELLFLDAGSTNLALCEFLPEDAGLTVATNSIDIAAAVLLRTDVQLIMIGGPVNPVVGGCVEAGAVAAVAQMNIDRLFLGACAVSAKSGVSAVEISDASFKRALLSASRDCLVLATTDKLDTRAPHRIAAIKDVSCLVVEHDAPKAQLTALAKTGVTILKAEPPQ